MPTRWISLCLIASAAAAQSLRIVVQSSPLAGFQYHAGPALWSQLRVGDALTLTREADNAHDGNAVAIHWHGQKLGYLPRADNRVVAAEMDKGSRVAARIERLHADGSPRQRLRVEVLVEP